MEAGLQGRGNLVFSGCLGVLSLVVIDLDCPDCALGLGEFWDLSVLIVLKLA